MASSYMYVHVHVYCTVCIYMYMYMCIKHYGAQKKRFLIFSTITHLHGFVGIFDRLSNVAHGHPAQPPSVQLPQPLQQLPPATHLQAQCRLCVGGKTRLFYISHPHTQTHTPSHPHTHTHSRVPRVKR